MSSLSPTLQKRIGALVLSLLIAVPASVTAFPRPAHAFLGGIVHDPLAYIKDIGLDSIGWMIAKTAIASMQRSLVNWINSGFQGSPAFATDLRQNLVGVGDAVVGYVVGQIAGDVAGGLIVNSPYQDQIATAIRTGYYLSTGGSFYVRNPFTLNQYSQDPRRFLTGDFSQGGFDAWYEAVTNCQNNPYCAYQLAVNEVDRELALAGGQRLTELNWGNGFLSFRGDCLETADHATGAYASAHGSGGSGEVSNDVIALVAAQNVSLADKEGCLNHSIKTPGAVIESQLNQALPKGMEGLVTADEIDEVIGALLQQLVNKVIGSTGLLSLSAPQSGGGRSYIDQAASQPLRPPPAEPDADTAAQLAVFEVSWQSIGTAAQQALEKCPESGAAQQALLDAGRALARVDGVRKAIGAGATVNQLGDLMPTDAEIAAAQAASGDTDGSLKNQLAGIAAARGCPSN
jgi:hypothetical protein